MFTEKGNIILWVEHEQNVCGGLEDVLCMEGIVGVCVYGVCEERCGKEGVRQGGVW